MNAVMGDPVLSELACYLEKLDTEEKMSTFIESIPWLDIIEMAGMDPDEIIDDFYNGKREKADKKIEAAKQRAFEKVQEQMLRDVTERDHCEWSQLNH
jgi:hypothetical protein